MGPGLILSLVALGLWPLGWAIAARWRRSRPGAVGTTRSVTVIIPARNEEANLPVLLDSLASQSVPPAEIIVVDDGSEDRTAEAARDRGAKVIASAPLPEGWRGKTWACHQGAQAAAGECLLFLDADTWFEPRGLETLLRHYPGGAWSAGPWHAVRRAYEDLSLFFNIAMSAGTVPQGLFGQMLLVDRKAYARVGGHAAVKDRILENFHLADRFRSVGIPAASELGRGLFSFRMYPAGFRDLCQGWTKAFASGAARTPPGVMVQVVGWMIGLATAFLALFFPGPSSVAAGVYLLCALQVAWVGRRVGRFGFWSALLYPAPLFFFFAIFGWSTLRRGKAVRWKGRAILAD